MDVALALGFLICLWFAMRGAFRGLRKGYQNKVATWDAENPDVPWPIRRGAMLGYLFSMLKDGPRFLLDGWKEGWAQGRAIGSEKWAQALPDPDAAQETVDPNQPGQQTGPQPGQRPDLKLVKPTPGPAGGAQPGSGTNGGGPGNGAGPGGNASIEVVDVETLLAFCRAKETQADAEGTEAAQAGIRVQDEVYASDAAAQAVTTMKYHSDDIALVIAIRETEKGDLTAIGARVAATSRQQAAAKAAVAMAARHVQIQGQKAAGQAYTG